MNSIITQDTLDQLTDSVELTPGGPVAVLNIPAGQWHTARALESGTVILEMKDGKYGPRACEEMNPRRSTRTWHLVSGRQVGKKKVEGQRLIDMGHTDKQEYLRRLHYMKGITFQYAFCTPRAIEKMLPYASK